MTALCRSEGVQAPHGGERVHLLHVSLIYQPGFKSTGTLLGWFCCNVEKTDGINLSNTNGPVSLTGAELGPVLRDAAGAPLRFLRVPLPGGNRRLATLWPSVRAAADLCLRHCDPLDGGHRQPPAGWAPGCVEDLRSPWMLLDSGNTCFNAGMWCVCVCVWVFFVFFSCFCRGAVPNQHAYQWAGAFGGQLPHQGSFQGSVCRVSFWRPSWWAHWTETCRHEVKIYLNSFYGVSLNVLQQPPYLPWWWAWIIPAWLSTWPHWGASPRTTSRSSSGPSTLTLP